MTAPTNLTPLPTLRVTPDQVTRLLAAFPPVLAEDGTTQLTSAQVYKRWLRDKLVEKVKAVEVATLQQQQAQALQAALAATGAALVIDPSV